MHDHHHRLMSATVFLLLFLRRTVQRPETGAACSDLDGSNCPLRLCRSVVATEVAKPSVAAALHNAAQNGISNVHIARLSSEEFVQAWRGKRVFNRLEVCLLCRSLWHFHGRMAVLQGCQAQDLTIVSSLLALHVS